MSGRKTKAHRLGVLEVRTRVEVLARMAEAKDYEAAHAQEDGIFVAVLEAVGAGHPHSAALAREALKAKDIKFDRWGD